MKTLLRGYYTGERALYMSENLRICEGVFDDGESPLKESKRLQIENCLFRWKYPLWYCSDVTVTGSTLFGTARAGIWYTENIKITDSVIEAPKTFRRSKNVTLERVAMPNAAETLWNCEGVKMKNVTACGSYLGMNCRNVTCVDFILTGDYCFDGAHDVVIKNSRLLSKDSFWNSKNVTVYDSFISGEYLGWNAENLTFVNCTIESLQALCYVKNLKLVNCKLINTTLAFEYSTVDAEIAGKIDSVKNPYGGVITADDIGELILEEDKVDPEATKITYTEAKR